MTMLMELVWFGVWWTMAAIALFIYSFQTGFKTSNSLTVELIKLIIGFPLVILGYLLFLIGLAE